MPDDPLEVVAVVGHGATDDGNDARSIRRVGQSAG